MTTLFRVLAILLFVLSGCAVANKQLELAGVEATWAACCLLYALCEKK